MVMGTHAPGALPTNILLHGHLILMWKVTVSHVEPVLTQTVKQEVHLVPTVTMVTTETAQAVHPVQSTNTLPRGLAVLLLLPIASAVERVLTLMARQEVHLVPIATMVTMEPGLHVPHVQLTNTLLHGQLVSILSQTVLTVEQVQTQTARQGRHLVLTATMVTMATELHAQPAQQKSFQQHGVLV